MKIIHLGEMAKDYWKNGGSSFLLLVNKEKQVMKTEHRTPKVGEWIILSNKYQKEAKNGSLNHLTEYFRNGGRTKIMGIDRYKRILGGSFKQLEDLIELTTEPIVIDKNKTTNPNLYLIDGYMSSTGEPFISVVVQEDEIINAEYDDDVYCKCLSPEIVVSYADWKSFNYCRKCRKERM